MRFTQSSSRRVAFRALSLICVISFYYGFTGTNVLHAYTDVFPSISIADQDDALTAANKLVEDANTDLDAIDSLAIANEKKIVELDKADKAGDIDKIKALLSDLIKVIDVGLKQGESAADKLERASNLNITDEFKSYLRLKSQSIRTQIKAFIERRDAASIMRYNYGGADEVRDRRVKEEFRNKNRAYKRLLEEAKELSHQADEVAKQHPDKIKGPPVEK